VRSKEPRPDGEVLAQLDRMAQFLHDAGLTEAEEKVREGRALAETNPEEASRVLVEAAVLVRAFAPEAR
jgi:hypothetical protein